MADLVNKLKARNVDVFLVSGGFRQMIKVGRVISCTGSFALPYTQFFYGHMSIIFECQ